ncbi:hypothetical protein PC116_g2124 [Phytophthora cactorum]|uniref:Uncharacterized protein n=1 Tax=Phytophthora cactorum TaxID=29920 RepID=A0A8T1LKN5_9STRA|nr:hypothetical protein Pcac1_g7889 [Phytophthora cactorum]KAG2953267.1 hypothetical protein PC117_g2126 [Phytophthora cactorum]KAG4250147.1 hypothetical protein PC116_g2124 [Phytophthora cactorum]
MVAKSATREAGHPGSQDVEMESVGEVDLADLPKSLVLTI